MQTGSRLERPRPNPAPGAVVSRPSICPGLPPRGPGRAPGSSQGPGKVDAFREEARQGLRRAWWSRPLAPGPAVPMLAPRPLLLLLLVLGPTSGASMPPGPRSHPGMCPNQLSPNLWVDAQSTCERECIGDQVSSALPLPRGVRPAQGKPRPHPEGDPSSCTGPRPGSRLPARAPHTLLRGAPGHPVLAFTGLKMKSPCHSPTC